MQSLMPDTLHTQLGNEMVISFKYNLHKCLLLFSTTFFLTCIYLCAVVFCLSQLVCTEMCSVSVALLCVHQD